MSEIPTLASSVLRQINSLKSKKVFGVQTWPKSVSRSKQEVQFLVTFWLNTPLKTKVFGNLTSRNVWNPYMFRFSHLLYSKCLKSKLHGMNFRHSITICFTQFGFQTPFVSENGTHKRSDFIQVWISDICCTVNVGILNDQNPNYAEIQTKGN